MAPGLEANSGVDNQSLSASNAQIRMEEDDVVRHGVQVQLLLDVKVWPAELSLALGNFQLIPASAADSATPSVLEGRLGRSPAHRASLHQSRSALKPVLRAVSI